MLRNTRLARWQRKGGSTAVEPVLDPDASTELRDRLLGELNELTSGDEAALWAHRSLAEKNKLTAADALRVEEAFQARLAGLCGACRDMSFRRQVKLRSARHARSSRPTKRLKPKSLRRRSTRASCALPEPRRVRDREHVRFVATAALPGLWSNSVRPSSFAFCSKPRTWRARSATSSRCRSVVGIIEKFTAAAMKQRGGKRVGINPSKAARTLWLETHPLTGRHPGQFAVEGRSHQTVVTIPR